MTGIHGYQPTQEDFHEWLEDHPGKSWDDFILFNEDRYIEAQEHKMDLLREQDYDDDHGLSPSDLIGGDS